MLRLVDHLLGALQAIHSPLRVRYGVVDEHMQVFETLFQTSPVPQVGITWIVVDPDPDPDTELEPNVLLLDAFELAKAFEEAKLVVVVTFVATGTLAIGTGSIADG